MTSGTRRALQLVSYIGLALSLVPALLVFKGIITKDTYLNYMLLGMLVWFGTAILWVKPEHLGE